jgi:hypothetical protein
MAPCLLMVVAGRWRIFSGLAAARIGGRVRFRVIVRSAVRG